MQCFPFSKENWGRRGFVRFDIKGLNICVNVHVHKGMEKLERQVD